MQYIEEKLSAKDPASKWVSDFVHSNNPKFAGKTKQERIKMALGAYYAAKREMNEEVEQIGGAANSELSALWGKHAAHHLMADFLRHEQEHGYTKMDGDEHKPHEAKAHKIRKEVETKYGADMAKKMVAHSRALSPGLRSDEHLLGIRKKSGISDSHYQKAYDSVDQMSEEAEQVDEANMRFDYEAAARPTSRHVKNFQNRNKNRRAAAATNKYIRRMTKLGGLGPNQTKKDTLRHMQNNFGEELEQIDENAEQIARQLSTMQRDGNWYVDKSGNVAHPYYFPDTVKAHVNAAKLATKLIDKYKDGNYTVDDAGNIQHAYLGAATINRQIRGLSEGVSEEVEQVAVVNLDDEWVPARTPLSRRRRRARERRARERDEGYIGKPGTYNREGIMLGKDGHPLIKTGEYRDWLFKTSHENAVAEVKAEHGEPTNHEYKFDSMSGRYGAHNSHLHYPGKKITVNTQMHKSGPRDTLQPVNNVFVLRNEQGVSEEVKGNHRPGWMLRADPKLAKKIEERKKRQKKREAAYGNPSAGESVKGELLPKQKEIQKSLVSKELAQNKKTNSTEYGRRVADAVRFARAARKKVNTQPITDMGKGQDA